MLEMFAEEKEVMSSWTLIFKDYLKDYNPAVQNETIC